MTHTWDAMGNRSGLSVNGVGYSFTYDINAGIPAVIEEVNTGGKTYYYYRDPSGMLIARRDAADPNGWQYYHYDEQCSTRILTNAAGQVTDTYAYDAYGSVIAHEGSTSDNPYQYVGALGYYTHHQDPEFGLLQLGFRFYDPETGRFTQQDPIGDGVNWYAYGNGDPFSGADPWGLAWYDGWLDGTWGSNIPILGGMYERAGTDYENWRMGIGSGWRAAGSGAAAIGGTVAASVGVYFGGRAVYSGGVSVAGWYAARRAAAAAGTVMITHWFPANGDKVIRAGQWVMQGRPSLWNYIRSGVWDPAIRYPYANSVSAIVDKALLRNPTTADGEPWWLLWVKLLYQQKIYTGPPIPPSCPGA